MDLGTIIYQKNGPVGTIQLNRPSVLNAVNRQLWRDLSSALDKIEKDNEVKVVIITGVASKEGKQSFSTGADLNESSQRTVEEYRAYLESLQEVSLRLIRFPKPTIAAINGYALGSGFELALACDIRIAAENATIGSPEARVSSTITGATSKLLPALIGVGMAKELLFSSEYISGAEAARIGLVNKAVPLEKLMDTALELAGKIAQNSSLSVSVIKNALERAATHSLEETMAFEVDACLEAVFSAERKAALENFTSKRRVKK